MSATGGHDVRLLDNTIAACERGILLSGAATTDYTVQRNRIGVNAFGVGLAQHANLVGIEIGGGSSQHVIGQPYPENLGTGVFSNDIRNNRTAGVNLTPSAGGYTTIRGNRIEANGRDGTGLGIDLGDLGQRDNDVSDADSGPNRYQNYPLIQTSVLQNGKRTVGGVLDTEPNQSLRLDFYRSPTCPDGATGANAVVYVGSIDVASAGGVANFSGTISNAGAPGVLTVTATRSLGDTSEFAPCFAEPPDDRIFANGFELAN